MHLLAKRCKEMHRGPRKTKLTVVFRTVGHTIEGTLSERFVVLTIHSACASVRTRAQQCTGQKNLPA